MINRAEPHMYTMKQIKNIKFNPTEIHIDIVGQINHFNYNNLIPDKVIMALHLFNDLQVWDNISKYYTAAYVAKNGVPTYYDLELLLTLDYKHTNEYYVCCSAPIRRLNV